MLRKELWLGRNMRIFMELKPLTRGRFNSVAIFSLSNVNSSIWAVCARYFTTPFSYGKVLGAGLKVRGLNSISLKHAERIQSLYFLVQTTCLYCN